MLLKLIIIFVVFSAAIILISSEENVKKSDLKNPVVGSFKWEYKNDADGSIQQQEGRQFENGQIVQGTFQWTSPEGEFVDIKYVADEGGYRPYGEKLPKSPQPPEWLYRALAYNAAHPEENNLYSNNP